MIDVRDAKRRHQADGTRHGFSWLVLSNDFAHRCGYVCVPPGHPWFGKPCDEIDADVHGGLTFAAAGTTPDEWWVGFDCAHLFDLPDPELPGYVKSPLRSGLPGAEIRTLAYVSNECRKLASRAHFAALRETQPSA